MANAAFPLATFFAVRHISPHTPPFPPHICLQQKRGIMHILSGIFLAIHIIGGTVSLVAGCVNIIRKKGDRLHKKIGRAFLIGMVATGISAFVLAVIRPNQFLFAVGVFSVYMVVSGYRYIRWNPAEGRHFGWFDRALTAAMVLAGLYFLWLGGLALSRANAFGTVFLVFGLLGGMYVVQDLRYHGGRAKRANFALLAHIQRMTGGFIASLTAFLVVNARHLPSEIPGAAYWLLPTVVITPLIVHWSRKAAKAQ